MGVTCGSDLVVVNPCLVVARCCTGHFPDVGPVMASRCLALVNQDRMELIASFVHHLVGIHGFQYFLRGSEILLELCIRNADKSHSTTHPSKNCTTHRDADKKHSHTNQHTT